MIEVIVIYGAILSGLWMLIACGFTLMYGVTKIINIAYGVPYTLAAYMMYLLTTFLNVPPLLSLALSLFIALAVNIVIYWLTIRPIMYSHVLTMTVTFILALAAIEIFRISFGTAPFSVPMLVSGSVELFGIPVTLQRLIILPISISVLIFLRLFIQRTRLGKAVRAVAQDREASSLMGINIQKMFLLSTVISTLLVALAGCLALSLEVVDPIAVLSLIVPMFAITILGGLGSMEGAVLASLLLGYVEIAVAFTLGSQFRGVVPLIATIIVLQVRPEGLFGKRG
jgi:branched-chain amino acid transport system permease protein